MVGAGSGSSIGSQDVEVSSGPTGSGRRPGGGGGWRAMAGSTRCRRGQGAACPGGVSDDQSSWMVMRRQSQQTSHGSSPPNPQGGVVGGMERSQEGPRKGKTPKKRTKACAGGAGVVEKEGRRISHEELDRQ